MAGVMGGHEMDARVRLAERAVDPGLAGPVDHAHDSVIVGPAADVPMTARAPAHSMVATAVRSGRAARSIPAVITGTGYCDSSRVRFCVSRTSSRVICPCRSWMLPRLEPPPTIHKPSADQHGRCRIEGSLAGYRFDSMTLSDAAGMGERALTRLLAG
jgi:hypothetical protein